MLRAKKRDKWVRNFLQVILVLNGSRKENGHVSRSCGTGCARKEKEVRMDHLSSHHGNAKECQEQEADNLVHGHFLVSHFRQPDSSAHTERQRQRGKSFAAGREEMALLSGLFRVLVIYIDLVGILASLLLEWSMLTTTYERKTR